jgi:DNA replication protein DnaC
MEHSKREQILLKASNHGLYYYYLKLGILKISEGTSSVVVNPIQNIGRRSFYVYFNSDKREWYYRDLFSPEIWHGDLFTFAALYYELDKFDQKETIYALMWEDMQLDRYTLLELEELSKPEWKGGLQHPILKEVFNLCSQNADAEKIKAVDFERKKKIEIQSSNFFPLEESKNVINNTSRLTIRTAQQRIEDAANQQDIHPFMDVFLQVNEMVFLFGDTGKGKSILAVQIADAISKGKRIMNLRNDVGPKKVMFYDFELTDKQFEKRYTDEKSGVKYEFSQNLYIDNIDFAELTAGEDTKCFEELLINKIKCDLLETSAEVLMIDNISFLSMQDAQDGQVAQTIMKLLKEMKDEMNITILVLAHTTKKTLNAITLLDMAGSKKLVNFADGVFALGQAKSDPNLRYLKQVKPSRSGELRFGEDNVLACRIIKNESFLEFDLTAFEDEADLLKGESNEANQEKKQEIFGMYLQGMTCRKIQEETRISKSTINRWINETKNSVPPTAVSPMGQDINQN